METTAREDAGRAVLRAYLPHTLIEHWAREPDSPRVWHRTLDGSLMLCDMSGFTAMSERLARLGKEGAELMAGILNRFFGSMLGIAGGWGGVQMKFGGDAMLLFFSGERNEERAAASALEMQRAMPQFRNVRAGGDVHQLRMRIGIHSGRFFSASAGQEEGVLHYLLMGADVSRTASVEGEAKPGQVVASAETAARLRARGARLVTAGSGSARVIRVEPPGRPRAAAVPDAPRDALLRYVLPPLAKSLANGRTPNTTAEHRRVTAVFINLLGVGALLRDRGDAEALAQVDAYLKMVLRSLDKHGGFLGGTDAAEVGDKLIILFGAPVSSEHDEVNAVRFALDMKADLAAAQLDLQHRIGISTGSVFAGEIGSAVRREYTVIGDGVNLAARLMAAAPIGEVYISQAAADRAQGGFELRRLRPLTVKGKSKPVPVFRLERAASPSSGVRALGAHEVVGRDQEIAKLLGLAARAKDRAGGWAFVSGEPGIGKSTLVSYAAAALRQDGWMELGAGCQSQQSRTVLAAWTQILRQLFGIEEGDSGGDAWRKLEAEVRRLQPARASFAPLVADLLSLPSEREPMLEFLDAKRRRALLNATVIGVLRAAAREHPLLLVFEDIHFADAPSLDLLAELLSAPPSSCLVIATARGTTAPGELSSVEPDVSLPLGELPLEAARRVAAAAGALDAHTIDAIVARAQGNPLFIEEMALHRGGSETELPLTINDVILARIDRLTYEQRAVLRAASVAGIAFDRSHVASLITDDDVHPEAIAAALESLVEDGFLRVSREEGASHAFAHVLTQEVVYETMLFGRRRELHHTLAVRIEDEHTNERAVVSGILLHHFERSGDASKTATYAAMTGERAASVFANREAIDYYTRSLEALQRIKGNHDADRSVLLERIGECLEMEGRQRAATDAFNQALAAWRARASRSRLIARDTSIDRMREAALCRRVAVSYERRSEYDESLTWLDEAERLLPARQGAVGSEVSASRSIALFRKGMYREAIESGKRAVAMARRTRDARRVAYAQNMLANSYLEEGSLRRAIRQLNQAIAIYDSIGDVYGKATANNNIGNAYQAQGDLSAALRHYEIALESYLRVGNDAPIVHNNMGEVLLMQGNVAAAIIHLREVVRAHDADAELRAVAGLSHVNLSRCMAALGDLAAARDHLRRGTHLLRSVRAEGLLAEARLQGAELTLLEGRPRDGLRDARTVLREAESVDSKMLMVSAGRIVGAAYRALGDRARAASHLSSSITLARRIGADQDEARSLVMLAQIAHEDERERGRSRTYLRRAISILGRMGAGEQLADAQRLQASLDGTA